MKIQLNKTVSFDIKSAPHVLITGTTGSGKSVCLNLIINQLIKNDSSSEMIFIDVKKVELYPYHSIKQCTAYADNTAAAIAILQKVYNCMMKRYSIMRKDGKRKYTGRNMYIFIDEYADIAAGKDGKIFQSIIAKIARLGRAASIHMILTVQYPTRDVINTQIKQNLSTMITFRTNKTGSLLTLGHTGAEMLNGKGDGILLTSSGYETRFQCDYISDSEINDTIARNAKQAIKKTFINRFTDYLIK